MYSYNSLMTMRPEDYAKLAAEAGNKTQSKSPLGRYGASQIAQENIADYMTSRYMSRIEKFGASSSARLLEASPWLRNVSNYLMARFETPIPKELEEGYRDAIRTAQAARGFGGGGTATTGEEARYLLDRAEQNRRELAPMVANFGQTMLGMAGMGGANRGMSAQEIEQMRIQDAYLHEAKKMNKYQRAIGVAQTAMQGVSMVASMVGGGIAGMATAQAGQAMGGTGPGPGMGFAMGALGQPGAVSDIYRGSIQQNMYNQYMSQLKQSPTFSPLQNAQTMVSPYDYNTGLSQIFRGQGRPVVSRQFAYDFLNQPPGQQFQSDMFNLAPYGMYQ